MLVNIVVCSFYSSKPLCNDFSQKNCSLRESMEKESCHFTHVYNTIMTSMSKDISTVFFFQDRYVLTSFISHVGKSMTSGHYIAYVRKGSSWYMMDDQRVSENLKDSWTLQLSGNKIQVSVITKDQAMSVKPYILFYEKETEVQCMHGHLSE